MAARVNLEKKYVHRMTRTEMRRLVRTANRAAGLVNGERGHPAPGHQDHPRMPASHDFSSGEPDPPGYTAPYRPVENPRVPGEFMVHLTRDTARKVDRSSRISDEDRADFRARFDASGSEEPEDYRDSER